MVHDKDHGLDQQLYNAKFCGSKKSTSNSTTESHHHLIPSKPLPTEPIRRVDLGPLGSFCTKPGFLGSQECLIRKVPQAIVAPFRRNPPESSTTPSVSQVVPIHRASISHSGTSLSTSTSTTTTSSSTGSVCDTASDANSGPHSHGSISNFLQETRETGQSDGRRKNNSGKGFYRGAEFCLKFYFFYFS